MNDSPSKSDANDERRPGHGSSNDHPKPPIKEFIPSPNHSSRNGARIDKVVLHCTEASLDSTLKEFQKPIGRQVSAHYVIDRNGDIYQMVEDSERANHCRGANEASIGIEHVGKDTDSLTDKQTDASAALIRWLLEQYDIPREKVFGHDFTPGYNLPGGTSCPDKLFGSPHAQSTVAGWVEANV
jgi:N-acetyl-anhydromuramyl-L-alanine amidase AmpD